MQVTRRKVSDHHHASKHTQVPQDLQDEGEYTCLLEDTSCVSDTLTGYLLGEIGRPGALSCGVDSLTTITLFK